MPGHAFLDLVAPRVPLKEPTVYHIAQLRKVLEACNPAVPTEALVVRLLVGSGMLRAQVCGVAVVGPDGLPDLMTDSLSRGRVELHVRWDTEAKGRRARRVTIAFSSSMALLIGPSWSRQTQRRASSPCSRSHHEEAAPPVHCARGVSGTSGERCGVSIASMDRAHSVATMMPMATVAYPVRKGRPPMVPGGSIRCWSPPLGPVTQAVESRTKTRT